MTHPRRIRRATGPRPPGRSLPLAAALIALAALQPMAPPGLSGQAPPPPPALRVLERELAGDVVEDSVGSIAGAVFVEDQAVWRGAFGWSDPEAGTLATPATLYRAGSITKTVTAMTLLRLVASGEVSLDDPVVTYVPELRRVPGPDGRGQDRGRLITLGDLATHTAGLAREPVNAIHGRGRYGEWRRKVVRALAETELEAPPGDRYGYSNMGYGLLGLALERATGVRFERLVSERVLEPLGMRDTRFRVSAEDADRLATGYVNLPGDTADPRVPAAEHGGRGYRVPGEGLYSTVEDLARLGMAITGATPLLPDSLRRLMLTDATPGGAPSGTGGPVGDHPGADRDKLRDSHRDTDRGARHGLGVHLLDFGSFTLAGHSGTVPGYTAYLLVDPERRTGIVLLRSYTHGATNLGALATGVLLDMRAGPAGTR